MTTDRGTTTGSLGSLVEWARKYKPGERPRLTADEIASVRGKLGPDIEYKSYFLSAEDATKYGLEIPQDWMVRLTPDPDTKEYDITYILPELGELTYEETVQHLAEVEEQATRAEQERLTPYEEMFPGGDIASYLQSMVISEDMTPEEMGTARNNQELFIRELSVLGRTPETEELVRALFPDITPEQESSILDYRREIKEINGIRQYVIIGPDGRAYNYYSGEYVGNYQLRTKNIEPSSNIRELLKQGGVPDEEVEKIIKVHETDMSAEEWHDLYVNTDPSWVKSATHSLFGRSFIAGIGDMISAGAGVAGWAKKEEMAANLRELAAVYTNLRPVTESFEPSFDTLIDPRFWQTQVAEALPFTMAFLAGSVIVAYAGTAAGIGALGTTILEGTYGAAAGFGESAMEAGSAYNEAIDRGMTPEQATQVANEVFRNNLPATVGLDAVEAMIGFANPTGLLERLAGRGVVKLTMRGGQIVGAVLTEGGQEWYQDRVTRIALGDKVEWDDAAKMQFLIGGLMGAGFAGGGITFSTIKNRLQNNLSVEMHTTFDVEYERAIAEGLPAQEAQQRALDKIAETAEGKELINAIMAQIKTEEAVKALNIQDDIEKEAFTHVQEKQQEVINSLADIGALGAEVKEPALVAEMEQINKQLESETDPAIINQLSKRRREIVIKSDIAETGVTITDAPNVVFPEEYSGKAYRAETGYKHDPGTTAADVVKYEQEELGNKLGLTPEKIKYLEQFDANDVVWVTKTKKDVSRYGGGATYDMPVGSRVLATDGEGGYLVLKGGAKPIKIAPVARIENRTPSRPNVFRSYQQAVNSVGDADTNFIIRTESGGRTSDRALMIQISSKIFGQNEGAEAKDYYDAVYKNAEGYVRADDFWELPLWAANVAGSFKNADFYVVRNLAEAKKFLSRTKYPHIMFSSVDINVDYIVQLAEVYKGEVVVGGYALPERFKDIKNITWYDTIKDAADALGVEYRDEVDYRHFKDTAVVPRLCMSQGCLHKCAFCTVPKELVLNDIESIDQQVDAMAGLNAPLIYLNDKTFGQAKNYEYLIEVNKRVKAAHPEFKGFIIQTTAAQFNKMTDAFIRDSGILYVELGVESYNNEMLKALHKPATEKLIDQAAERMRKQGTKFIPNILIGTTAQTKAGKMIQETTESYQRTLDFLKRNADIISHINIYNLAVYEGTELADIVQVSGAEDINENVIAKSFHEKPEVHAQFAHDIYMLAQAIAERKYSVPAMTRLIHYGAADLTTIDPAYQYTGQSGSEQRFYQEYERWFKEGWFARRSYYYRPGQQVEARFRGKPEYNISAELNIFDVETATDVQIDQFDAKRGELLEKYRKEFGKLFGNLPQQGAEVDYATAKALGYDAVATPAGVAVFKALSVSPLTTVADESVEEVASRELVTGGPRLSLSESEAAISLFADYLSDRRLENIEKLNRQLMREQRAARAENLRDRLQQLIVEEGQKPASERRSEEEVQQQAIAETLSGPYQQMTFPEFIDNMTQKMRDALFAKVSYTLQDEPWEFVSTRTALTNALTKKRIPRIPGRTGKSAYTRLMRVFGTDTVKLIDTMSDNAESLHDVVEGMYHEAGREPIPVDEVTAEWLRQLPSRPYGQAWLQPSEATITQLSQSKTPEEIAQETLELRLQLAKEYPPITTRFEPEVEKGFEQLPLMPMYEKKQIYRVLKEVLMSPIDIGNLVRGLKASFDNSFLRQGKVLASGHPLVAYKAHSTAWRTLFNQKEAEAEWQSIIRDPEYAIYDEIRARFGHDPLRVPGWAGDKGTAQWRYSEEYGFGAKEAERFIPRLTAKITEKIGERGFVSGTNKIVWSLWKDQLRFAYRYSDKIASGQIKLKEGEAFDIISEMADYQKFLADAIQRAQLKVTVAGRTVSAQGLAPAVNALFFAARSKMARFVFPQHLISSNPRVRKEAWKDFVMMNALWGGLMFFGHWLDLWELETDPRSAEFMSARIGNTRIDPWAGYRQFVVLYARLVTGTGISSVTGAEYEVDKQSALVSFFRNSLSPLASTLLEFWTGRNFLGVAVDYTDKKEWIKRILPFAAEDIWEAFEDGGWGRAAVATPAAIYGEGVQTYSGDWEVNYTKLGTPKYEVNTGYGMTEPRYDTSDLWSDTASQFRDVDPESLTPERGYPAYIKAMAEAYITLNEQVNMLPSEKLVSINADPEQGTTFQQYRQMWLDRHKLELQGDDEALEEFDKDERTRNAYMGNMTSEQYTLLVEYHSITDKKKQAEFLDAHPELNENPRHKWLAEHPEENAQLAIWGQAPIYTKEAYTLVSKLMEELDLPTSALPEFALPPEKSVDNYFTYRDYTEKNMANSWEVQLLLIDDPDLRKFLKRDLPEYSRNVLELLVKHRDIYDLSQQLSDKKSPYYIADDKERRERLKEEADYQAWVDDNRRVDVLKTGGTDDMAEKWVERGSVVDEHGAGSSEAILWLIDNPDMHQWALDNELLTDAGEDWNEKVIRINVEWAEKDDAYDALETDEERALYLKDNPDYAIARRQRNFYKLPIDDKGFSSPGGYDELRDKYVAYYQLPSKGYFQEHYLLDNPDLENILTNPDIMGSAARMRVDPEKVPDKKYDEIYIQYKTLFDKWDAYADPTDPLYIDDSEARAAARDKLYRQNPDFKEAKYRRDAYITLKGYEDQVDNLVQYKLITDAGKPPGQKYWFDDDWFLMDHPELYKTMVRLGLWKEKDFSRVPPKDVFDKWMVYDSIMGTEARRAYRRANPDFDAWLYLIGAVTKTMPEYDRDAGLTTGEIFAREMLNMKSTIEMLKASIEERLRGVQP